MYSYDKQRILELIRPHSDCIYEDNEIVRDKVLKVLLEFENNFQRDEIRELLIAYTGRDGTAEEFFRLNTNNEHLISVLVEIALDDYSGDARMHAAYWIAQFNKDLLLKFEDDLLKLQNDDWWSVSNHILVALAKINSKEGLKYLIESRIVDNIDWLELKALKYYLGIEEPEA